MSFQDQNKIFENLFILEMANNHWGDVERGKRLVREHGKVVHYNNIKAAIKLQFRDVNNFIHQEYKGNKDVRYISKTEATAMSREDYAVLVHTIKDVACIPMATPFDESSVDLCVEFNMPLIKVASSDVNDWPLLEKIAWTKLPVIVSSGGASEKDLDDIVSFFEHRNITLAINHCVALYPSEFSDLEMNQIDYLKQRYPHHVIGFSTHEYQDWQTSMLISYAKGARTWERHVDIDYNNVKVSPYCSLPEQIDDWFKAYKRAQTMCGGSPDSRRICEEKEIVYLDALVRGIYAKRNLEAGYVFSSKTFSDDFYLAIPLRKKQLSCREIINGETLIASIAVNEPLTIDHVDSPLFKDARSRAFFENRGA